MAPGRRSHRDSGGHAARSGALVAVTPSVEIWVHLWRTYLLELVWNTLALLVGVGLGVFLLGTGLAWLVTMYHFPGRRFFEWLLILPMAVPAYVMGFVFLGLFDFTGPVRMAGAGCSGQRRGFQTSPPMAVWSW